MGGGQSDVSNIGTLKGQGYRIMHVRPNSPLETFVEPYFDFIIDAIPSKQPQRNPRQILDKLTDNQNRRNQKAVKKLSQLLTENENQVVSLKIVSTKYRNVRTVQVTPNKNWNGHEDLIGIETRLERYDEAFQTYFPVSDVRPNSPIKKAGVKEGEYLIGCKQFKYSSINQLLENLYDRFFDKQVQNKNVHLALYNINTDELKVTPVLLARGWGDKGLLGCQFLQGHLNRFPKNLASIRDQLKIKKKQSDDNQRLKRQLSDSNGASVQLIQSLRAQKSRKPKTIKHLKNLLLIEPTRPMIKEDIQPKKEQKEQIKQQQQQGSLMKQPRQNQQKQYQQKKEQYVSLARFRQLEDRVATLQQMLNNVKSYIENIGEEDQEA